MMLELSERDAQLLREVLFSYLKELRGEIVDTDNHSYKRILKDEREQLDSIAARLAHLPRTEDVRVTRITRVSSVWEMSGLD